MVLIFLAASVSLVAGYILCKRAYVSKQKKSSSGSSVNAVQIGDDNKILVTIDTGFGKKAQVCIPVFRVDKSVVQERKLGFYPDSQDPNAESYAYSHTYVGVRDNDTDVLLLPPLNYTGKLNSPHFRYESRDEKYYLRTISGGDTPTVTEGGFFGLWSDALRKIFESPKLVSTTHRRNIYDD